MKQVGEWLTRSVGDANHLAGVGSEHFAVVMPKVMKEEGVAPVEVKPIEVPQADGSVKPGEGAAGR